VTNAGKIRPLPWHQEVWEQLTDQFLRNLGAHAYLLSGESDTGKHHFANAMSRFLLCRAPIERIACDKCPVCLLNIAGNNPDLLHIKPEDGSKLIKVEQIREIRHFLETSSHAFGHRIVIIDTAENMGVSSGNALLKGLEEPPLGVVFFVLTDRPKAVLSTISSRCQTVKLPGPSQSQSRAWLEQQADVAGDEIELLLDVSQNRPFAALRHLQEGTANRQKEVAQGLLNILRGEESVSSLSARYAKLESKDVLTVLLYWISSLCKYSLSGSQCHLKGRALTQAAVFLPRSTEPAAELIALYDAVSDAQKQLLSSSNPNAQLLLEDILFRVQSVFHNAPGP
jgi:DNA polymerase-3 subunit delta'